MIIHECHIEDLEHGPETLLAACRKVKDKYMRAKAAREARDLLLYRLSDEAKNGKPLSASQQDVHDAAFLPAEPSSVLAACDAWFRPRPGVHADTGRVFAEHLGMDGIQTILIQQAGRWCEYHAADLLLNLSNIQPLDTLECAEVPEPGQTIEWVQAFGFRRDGVDGNSYVMSRLKESRRGTPYVRPEYDYRKLLAVYVTDEPENDNCIRRRAMLIDVMHELNQLDPADDAEA